MNVVIAIICQSVRTIQLPLIRKEVIMNNMHHNFYSDLAHEAEVHSISFKLNDLPNVIITYIPHKDILLCDALTIETTIGVSESEAIAAFCKKKEIPLEHVFCHVTYDNHIYLTQLFRKEVSEDEVQEK